jgi:hypothetical protein
LSGVAWTTITATVALASALLALLFQLLPSLKPDPRENVGADVAIYRFEPHVSVAEWLRRAFSGDQYDDRLKAIVGAHPTKVEVGQLNTDIGELVYVRTTVDGFKHKHVSVRVRLYDAKRQEPLYLPPDLAHLLKISRKPLRIDAPSRRSVQLLWIPDLSSVGGAFVRVEMLDDNGILAVADSLPLRRGRIRE